MADDNFIRSITYSTNDVKKIRERFDLAKKMFQEVLNDN